MLVAAIEVRGLDDTDLMLGDRASGDAFRQALERCAWAQPREAQVAALSDRHGVLVVPVAVPSRASQVAELGRSLHEVLDRPVTVAGQRVRLSASIGVVTGPDDGDRFGVLATRARAVAGRAGTGSVTTRFDPAGLDEVSLDLLVANRVAWTLAHDAITVAYQPVVDARSGGIRSVEALVRCWHPVLGDLPSERIVASAEGQGVGLDLFRTVLRRSLRAVHGLR